MRVFTLCVLGAPTLISGEDGPVRFLSRKAEALFVYLALRSGRAATRERLSGLLWGNAADGRARASLRQCLRQLSAIHCREGSPLVCSDRNAVWINSERFRVDAEEVLDALERPSPEAIETVWQAVRGPILDGAEIGEGDYDEAIGRYRQWLEVRLVSRLESLVCVGDVADAGGVAMADRCAEALLKVEPVSDAANRWLIERSLDGNRADRALRLFARYRHRLEVDLGLPPPPDLAARIERLRTPEAVDGAAADPGARALAAARPVGPAMPAQPPPPAAGVTAADVGLGQPRLCVRREPSYHPLPDLFGFAVDEVLFQLSKFRDLRVFDDGGADGTRRVAFSPAVESDVRLAVTCHPERRTIHLSVTDARSGEILFRERLSPEVLEERGAADLAIARCVNALEQDVLTCHARRTRGATTYGRWLEAFELMNVFDAASDERAFAMLERMADDPVDRRLSVVHSSMGSILMKRRLMVPGADRDGSGLERAAALARTALSVDPLEPFNHVIAGWAALQRRDYANGLAAFDHALRLNSYSARVNMAAAEAYGYAGDPATARTLANKAMTLVSPRAPPYFYGYTAMIEFMAGNVDACLALVERAPENNEMRALKVAALARRGSLAEASRGADALVASALSGAPAHVDRHEFGRWLTDTVMFRDPAVRSSWVEGLAAAGLQLPPPPHAAAEG